METKIGIEANIGIKESCKEEVAEGLAKILADENVLYVKTKNAHWNIEGADFYEKHLFFESQSKQLDQVIDDVAERIRALGHYAPGSLKSFLELTQLSEMSREKNDSNGFIRDLLIDHESIIISLREKIHPLANEFKDAGTSDFVTGLTELHEKMAWFLRSHLT